MARKTWLQKFHTGQKPQLVTSQTNDAGAQTGETFLTSSPAAIDNFTWQIPFGRSVLFHTMKLGIALSHGVVKACPHTTGTFTQIAAERAFEPLEKGSLLDSVTPLWKVVDVKTPFVQKLAWVVEFIAKQRSSEGLEPFQNTAKTRRT